MVMPTCLPTSSDGSNSIPQVLPHGDKIPFEDDPSTPLLSQIRWRCRRGMLELDIWLMRYVDRSFEQASPEEQQLFLILLNLPDPELSACLLGQQTVVNSDLAELINKIRSL